MRAPIIVNESSDINSLGDLDVFSTVHDAELYHEPWYVKETYFAFDADGRRLEMLPDEENYKVSFRPMEGQPCCKDIVVKYLREDLQRVAEEKGWSFIGASEDWLQKASFESLLDVSVKLATT